MKITKLLLFAAVILFATACGDDEEPSVTVDVPETFTVDIPNTLSSQSGGSLNGRTTGECDNFVEGNEIYASLRYFIWLGEESAEIAERSLIIATFLNNQNVTSLTFESEDDGRLKRLELTRDVTRAGVSYENELMMFDEESNGRALQLLWNTNPVSGVAILNPYNIDRIENTNPDAFLRIDYTEDDPSYEASMLVSISGLDPEEDEVSNIKMFVGRNGDVVEVRGNSDHPNLTIIDPDFTGGRNYAFVGRGDESADLGVVNLALPPSNVSTSDVFSNYSVKAVLQAEIASTGINLGTELENCILQDAESPAYFNASGFIDAGVDNKPVAFDSEFVDLSGLNPFVPVDIRDMEVDFISQ